MATQKKLDIVSELSEKFARAKVVVIADYQGIKHKQLEELRKLLKKVQAEFTVAKNTLLKKALAGNKKTISDKTLHSGSAALFAYEDEASPLKELTKFFKATNAGKLKGGLLGDQELSEIEVERLATLPGKDQLRAQVVGQLKAPLYGLHNALSWNLRKLVWTLEAVKKGKTQ